MARPDGRSRLHGWPMVVIFGCGVFSCAGFIYAAMRMKSTCWTRLAIGTTAMTAVAWILLAAWRHGDDASNAATSTLNVEGQSAFSGAATAANVFQTKTMVVNVVDGKLTLDAGNAADKATRLNYVEITPVASV